MSSLQLRYVPYEDIDRQLYNSCVHFALNGRPWGYKWWLEATARRFDVLVEGEYESVMPLVWHESWLGRREVTMPVLTPGLGIFSVHVLSPKRVGYFLREVSARFDAIDQVFTAGESARAEATEWAWQATDNYVMSLDNRSYDEIAGEYAADLLRRLAIANEAKLLVHANLKPERLAAFVAEHARGGQRLQHPMLRILYNAMHRGWGWSSAVTDAAGQLLAIAAFVTSHGRVSPFVVCESQAGQRVHARDLLFDYAIRQSAGRPILLDFASSQASVYADFGAQAEQLWRAQHKAKLLGIIPV